MFHCHKVFSADYTRGECVFQIFFICHCVWQRFLKLYFTCKCPKKNMCCESTRLHWQKVSKYIYSSTVLMHNFEILVFYLSISISCNFTLLLHYISEWNIALLFIYIYIHSSDSYSCMLLYRLRFYIQNIWLSYMIWCLVIDEQQINQ